MAEASILDHFSVDQFSCPVCLDLLNDPVTTRCGHSYCKVCINGSWDQEDEKGVYSCPQCRDTFTPRPVLRTNNMLAEVVEKLKKTEVQAASPAHCYAGPGDVECDFCTGRKHKAVKCCLMCLSSFCQAHLKPHLQLPALKKHTLIEASSKLQEQICSQHDKLMEIFCRTDQSCICSLCMLESHNGHDAVSLSAERTEKQSLQSLCVSSVHEDSPSITVHQHRSCDGVRNSLSDLKKRFEEFCDEEFNKIPPHAAAVRKISLSEPKSREDFLKYFCYLTLDPNTANHFLRLSESNRVVKSGKRKQPYSDRPERFDSYNQVLCKENVCGRCYWEVEWSGAVDISVSYTEIKRKGQRKMCLFGLNSQSWSLCCSSSLHFCHNDIKTELRVPSSSRIGVYVDHSAGSLSFYSVSDTMRLIHRVHTTFTQPLYAGFGLYGGTLRLCDSK